MSSETQCIELHRRVQEKEIIPVHLDFFSSLRFPSLIFPTLNVLWLPAFGAGSFVLLCTGIMVAPKDTSPVKPRPAAAPVIGRNTTNKPPKNTHPSCHGFTPSFLVTQNRFKIPAGQNSCMLLPINSYLVYKTRLRVKHTHRSVPIWFLMDLCHTTEATTFPLQSCLLALRVP